MTIKNILTAALIVCSVGTFAQNELRIDKNIKAWQPEITPVSCGTPNNAVLRLNFKVIGSSGQLPLQSLTATAMEDAANSGTTNPVDSVKLFHTKTNTHRG